jgi:hypothetical protein
MGLATAADVTLRRREPGVPQRSIDTRLERAGAAQTAFGGYDFRCRVRGREHRATVGTRRHPSRDVFVGRPTLLQGLMVCGRCGSGVTVRYDAVNGKHSPRYLCQSHRRFAKSPCQSIPGAALDAAIGELVVEAVSPTALEASLDVQRELSARIEEADQLRHRQVERSQYEAQLARRRRFLRVDPDNRLVAAPSRPTTKALPARKSARGTASAGASNRSSTMNQPIAAIRAGSHHRRFGCDSAIKAPCGGHERRRAQ